MQLLCIAQLYNIYICEHVFGRIFDEISLKVNILLSLCTETKLYTIY